MKKDALLPADLPDGRGLIGEGRGVGDDVVVGTSLMCQTQGVASEF